MNPYQMLNNPLFWIDFYKSGHVKQYPSGVSKIFINLTPRTSRVPAPDGVTFFGLQAYIKQTLIQDWKENFFDVPIEDILAQYREVLFNALQIKDPYVAHIEQLHSLGYLPIKIWAIPEGFRTPLRVPNMVITNTVPEAYWLPNYLETNISNMLWKACTSATTARKYRKIFEHYAKAAGETDFSFIDWMGHDFSYRGMSGLEDAVMSGMGHLLSFSGTDTIPAILAARAYYDADLTCGGSVPATEHSVMCAGSKDGEFDTFKRLLTEVYPSGIVSIVSDTWDLWQVLTKYIPLLKDDILARDGKIVIRPDSGDPVKILTGDDDALPDTPEFDGAVAILADVLGYDLNPAGLAKINKGGLIYGDSITVERAEEIMRRTVENGYSPYNLVLGIGSFTYEYVTRDTFGFAIKATAVVKDGQLVDIFKKPVTDDGMKESMVGIPAVYRTEDSTDDNPVYFATQKNQEEELDNCEFLKVFEDGKLLVDHKFSDVRKRARS